MSKLQEFFQVYREYRRVHSIRYAVWIAYGIAFKGLPF